MDKVIWGGGFEFLGAPVGSNEFCENHSAERADQAKKLWSAITELDDPQVGLRLMRACAGFCKLVYSARVVCPDAHMWALQTFDTLLRDALSELTGLQLSDRQWAQAGRSFRTQRLASAAVRNTLPAPMSRRG